MRYSGDDYCYGGILKRLGFWQAQWYSYLNPTPYHGNRYSLTFLSDFVSLFPPIFNGFLPGAAIVFWLLGLVMVLKSIAKYLISPIHILNILLSAEIVIFFTLTMAPDLAQSLYWRSGTLPYLAPMIANMYLIALMLQKIQKDHVPWFSYASLCLFAFFSGGFSETAVALQAGFLILAVLGSFVYKKAGGKWASTAVQITLAALIGTLLAMLFLMLSPSNQSRLAELPPRPDPLTLIQMSIHNAYIFVHASVKRLFLPNSMLVVAFGLLSFHSSLHDSLPRQLRGIRLIIWLILVPVLGFFLIVCCVAPSAYAQSSYPELRALIAARYVMVISASIFGMLVGLGMQHLQRRLDKKPDFLITGTILLLGLMSIYPIFIAKDTISEIPRYDKWATFWDERDSEIREAARLGVRYVEVVKIDNIIPRVSELRPDEGNWYNNCAEWYYGVRSISANQPGWDD